jgi:hypothetical protein
MPEARDAVASEMRRLDAHGGRLEKAVQRAAADHDYAVPAALAGLAREDRARTGIYLVLGYRPRVARSERIIREVAEGLRRDGWRAMVVDVPDHGTTRDDAEAVHRTLAAELPQVHRAIAVGFSKGGCDWIHWFAGPAGGLPAEERAKLRLFISFAGALRGSTVAGWTAEGDSLTARALRTGWRLKDRADARAVIAEARSLAPDPWATRDDLVLRRVSPRLRAVCVAVIPDGEDGHPSTDLRFRLLSRFAARDNPVCGPGDGLVESAAQVLPASAGVPQEVVRVFGSHAVLDGRYGDGTPVSRRYGSDGPGHWESGRDLMEALLRALPKSAAGW